MVIRDLDPWLPIGSPVDVELVIDVKHNIQVRVRVRETGRCESAAVEAPPPPRRPTRAAIDEVQRKIDELLPNFSGGHPAPGAAAAAGRAAGGGWGGGAGSGGGRRGTRATQGRAGGGGGGGASGGG